MDFVYMGILYIGIIFGLDVRSEAQPSGWLPWESLAWFGLPWDGAHARPTPTRTNPKKSPIQIRHWKNSPIGKTIWPKAGFCTSMAWGGLGFTMVRFGMEWAGSPKGVKNGASW